jgi:hypothetical protein
VLTLTQSTRQRLGLNEHRNPAPVTACVRSQSDPSFFRGAGSGLFLLCLGLFAAGQHFSRPRHGQFGCLKRTRRVRSTLLPNQPR